MKRIFNYFLTLLMLLGTSLQASAALPNGVYRIASYCDTKFGLDVSGSGTTAGTKLHLWEYGGGNNQKFRFTANPDGTYYVTPVHAPNLYVTFEGKGNANDCQLQITATKEWANTWTLVETGTANSGVYFIKTTDYDRYIDVNNGNMANGEKLHAWDNKANSQKWILMPVDDTNPVADGNYRILSAHDESLGIGGENDGMNDGTNVNLQTFGGHPNQKWTLTHKGDGFYTIKNKLANKELNVSGNDFKAGTNVQLWDTESDGSQWALRDAGNGYYYIINKNGLFLDVSGANFSNGTNIQGWYGNSGAAQKWKFVVDEIILNGIEWKANPKSYDGYQMVELTWRNKAEGNTDPINYDVYCDGKLVAQNLQTTVFIHNNVTEGAHTYKIVGRCPGYNNTVETADREVNVARKSSLKSQFKLQTIYNNRIGSGKELVPGQKGLPGDFADLSWGTAADYRQGAFYNGKWNIIRKGDASVLVVEDAAMQNLSTGTYATSHKLTENGAGTSVGIATDEAGNIIVRSNGRGKLGGTASGANFAYDLGEMRVYPKSIQGSGDWSGSYTVQMPDLRQNIHDTEVSNSAHVTNDNNLYVDGRADYFRMSGNVAAGTGRLYVAYGNSRLFSVYKVPQSAGSATTVASWYDKPDFIPQVENENYLFPIAGREATGDNMGELVHQVRSNAYAQVDKNNGNYRSRKIRNESSRVNNTGGTTIKFNDQLLLITGMGNTSRAHGSFEIAMANRVGDNFNAIDVDQAALDNLVPVMTVNQAEASEVGLTFSSGNWLFAENGTINVDGENKPCVYIYQYVPCTRIAKYALYVADEFPASQPELNIETKLTDDGKEIEKFVGTSTFPAVEVGSTSGLNDYEIENYLYTLRDKDGNIVYQENVKPYKEGATDNDPNWKKDKDGNLYYTVDHSKAECLVGNGLNGGFNRNENYTAEVTVQYENTHTGVVVNSDTKQDVDIHDYEPKAPDVTVYAEKNDKYGVRFDIDFNEPADVENNPVSYYVIEYWAPGMEEGTWHSLPDVQGDKDDIDIANQKYVADSFSWLMGTNGGADTNFNVTDGAIVPGDFDFDHKGQYVLRDYVGKPCVASFYFPNVEGAPADLMDPLNWQFRVTAVYADGTKVESRASGNGSAASHIVTGVEDVVGQAISSVKYVNALGMSANYPFAGVNIVITTYTDGTTKTVKIVF